MGTRIRDNKAMMHVTRVRTARSRSLRESCDLKRDGWFSGTSVVRGAHECACAVKKYRTTTREEETRNNAMHSHATDFEFPGENL